MRRKDFSQMECSIARAVDEVCEPWTLLLLRQAFLGARRFSDFQDALHIPTNTLASRLASMVEKSLFERVPYEERPPRYEYRLTERARELFPLLVTLADWGSKWKSPSGAPFELVDRCTGEPVELRLMDARQGKELAPGSIALQPGPGASKELRLAMEQLPSGRLIFGASRKGAQS